MSQENVEIVRRVHEAWAVGDPEAAFEALAEDAELDERNAVRTEMLGVYRGRTEIEAVLRHQMEVFDEWQVEALEIIDAGDQVVVHVRITGRGKESGVLVDATHARVWELRDGLVTRCTLHQSKAEALEAAGLSEQDAHADS
jgi:ketosteroid isomerase-like protein